MAATKRYFTGGSVAPAVHILVVDDHTLLVDLLTAYLSGLNPPIVVAAASTMLQGLSLAQQTENLRLAVLDRHVPDMDGFAGLAYLRRVRPNLPVAIMTGDADAKARAEAERLGAVGYVVKTIGAPAICEAFRAMVAGGRYFPELSEGQAPPPGNGRAAHIALTPRELLVLEKLIDGLSNKEMAYALDIAPVTVSLHLTNLYRKLGVASRAQAVRRAFEVGLAAERRG